MRNFKLNFFFFFFFIAFLIGCKKENNNNNNNNNNNKDVTPPVLNSPIDDANGVVLGTYFNEPNCQPLTSDNPLGLHKGWDFYAPTGTAIKASLPGTVISITTQTDSGLDHVVVLESVSGGYTMNYNLEPANSIVVVKGQVLKTGDIIGYLGYNTMNPMTNCGTLDFRLIDNTNAFTCMIPFVSPEFKSLVEKWFDKYWTPTSEHPGPCTCHYHY